MARLRIDGLKELEKKLKDNIKMEDVRKTVQMNGIEMQDKMQHKAEFVKGYQTGATKWSIGVESKDDGFTTEVGPTTEYAEYVEYGTRHMEAQPFINPAFEEQKGKFKSDLEKLVR